MKILALLCLIHVPAAILAAKCTYDNQEYEEGTSFPSNDGCNTCYCEGNGFVSCTEGCLPGNTPGNCYYNGQTYKIGDAFLDKDGCNRCTCERDQKIACTKKACVREKAKCKDSNGIEHPEGTSIPADDGCNTCVCTQTSMFICTLKECPVEPADETPILKRRRQGDKSEAATGAAALCSLGNYWVGMLAYVLVRFYK